MQRARRIAFLSEHASPLALLGSTDAGGQNVYVDEVSRGLAALGYAVDVFTRRDAADLPTVVQWATGVRVVHLAAGPAEFLPKDELWPLMPVFRDALLQFMRAERIRYDLIHGNFWMSGWVAAELRRRLDLPVVQIFHALGKIKQQHQGAADTSPDERIAVELAIMAEVDQIVAQCPHEIDELTGEYAADPARITLIPSAVDTVRYRPIARDEARRRLGLDPDAFIVTYVGRMLPRKDPRNIVRAVALLAEQTDRPVKLMLVGGETAEPDPLLTPELGALQQLAAELGIADRVISYGKRQPDVLHEYYSAGDVAVTTPWYEPFGLTPLEGMACGRPVVGSAVGGLTFTIQDGQTGLLVPPRDPAALAAALRRLLEQPALATQMGHAARARVEREFTWGIVAERTAALYQSLLARRMPGTRRGPQPPTMTARKLREIGD